MGNLFSKSKLFVSIILVAFTVSMPCCAQRKESPEEKLNMAMYAIMNMYVDSVDKARFVDQQIARMLKELDPFTMFLPPVQATDKEEALGVAPLSQPQAENAQRQAVQSAQQTASSTVRYYMLTKETGYARLQVFSQMAAKDFRQAVESLKKQGMKHLILDIRGNHGGLTDVAVELADELLDGEKTVFTAEGAHIDTQTFKTGRPGCYEHGRLVVLTDGETMSASELFAGAIQDWDRGVIIGETTYGKGLVQETLGYGDGSAIQISVARDKTPAGRTIQKPYLGHEQLVDSAKTFRSMVNNRPLKEWGGIQPDVELQRFDPPYFTQLYTNMLLTRALAGVANTFVEQDQNRLQRQYKSHESFVKNFDACLLEDGVRAKAKEMQLIYTEDEYRQCIDRLLLEAKAFVGRKLFDSDDCYYRVIANNTNVSAEAYANSVLRKALDVIGSREQYEALLGK